MKRAIYFLFFLLLIVFGACKKDKQSDPDNSSGDYQLVWSDEFDYTGLPDGTRWSYDVGGSGWGNNEAQYYTEARIQNAEVKNGNLYINALKESFEGKNYTSARLVTKGKGDWTYGKIEVRAKLPSGTGMWPAIWMLPSDDSYGGWPSGGELDIMENLGYIPGYIVATAQTQVYTHTQGTQKTSMIFVLDCYTNFHSYILDWDASQCRFYVDTKLYFTFKNEGTGFQVWPFDKPFHLILNVAVGGTYGGTQGIDDSIFPRSMIIDYVRVYQKKP